MQLDIKTLSEYRLNRAKEDLSGSGKSPVGILQSSDQQILLRYFSQSEQ